MSFIRKIKKKSGIYLAEVESYRDGTRVRQRLIRYLGKEGSLQPGVTTLVRKHDNVVNKGKQHSVVRKEAPQKTSTTKTTGKIESNVVNNGLFTTPLDVQILLQTQAREHNMTAEEYLAKLLSNNVDDITIKPDFMDATMWNEMLRRAKNANRPLTEWALGYASTRLKNKLSEKEKQSKQS